MPLILVLFLATLASAYVCYTIAKERHADAQILGLDGCFIWAFSHTFCVSIQT